MSSLLKKTYIFYLEVIDYLRSLSDLDYTICDFLLEKTLKEEEVLLEVGSLEILEEYFKKNKFKAASNQHLLDQYLVIQAIGILLDSKVKLYSLKYGIEITQTPIKIKMRKKHKQIQFN